MQYLYQDGDLYNFMDMETYDQIALDADVVGDALKFVKENETVKVCSHNGNVFSVEPPLFVELAITETEPGFKGDTAQGATKAGYSRDRGGCQCTAVLRDRRRAEDRYTYRRVSVQSLINI